MRQSFAVIGFTAHTGWVSLVAAREALNDIEILLHRRIALVRDGDPVPRFIYHEAAKLPIDLARDLVDRARHAVRLAANAAVEDCVAELSARGFSARRCAIVGGAARLKEGLDLAVILAAHTLIHAAEGRLYRDAIAAAARGQGIEPALVPQPDALLGAARTLGCGVEEIHRRLNEQRKAVGAPWTSDEKLAAAAALSLSRRKRRSGSG